MRLHAWVDGPVDAPPLVLLGSVGSTSAMWEPVLAPLLEQFRVIRLDHRGHGDSAPSPSGAAASLADLAADVLATLDALDVQRADWVGLSLGAMVGMWLAAHRPERLGRLALLCTSAYLGSPYVERARLVRADGMASVADSVVDRWLTPPFAARSPELRDELRVMVAGIDAESYAQCCDAIGAMDLRPDLGRIASSTLVIAAENDPATTPDHLRVIAEGIPRAHFESLADAAHIATYEQPARIATLLLQHLRAGATLADGYATRREVLGDAHVDRAIEAATPLTKPFQDFITRYAWGDVWSRTDLARRERSIATLACLVALGAEHELAMHIRAARHNGLSANEIVEVLMHCALYAGLPRANRAVAIASAIFDESSSI